MNGIAGKLGTYVVANPAVNDPLTLVCTCAFVALNVVCPGRNLHENRVPYWSPCELSRL